MRIATGDDAYRIGGNTEAIECKPNSLLLTLDELGVTHDRRAEGHLEARFLSVPTRTVCGDYVETKIEKRFWRRASDCDYQWVEQSDNFGDGFEQVGNRWVIPRAIVHR